MSCKATAPGKVIRVCSGNISLIPSDAGGEGTCIRGGLLASTEDGVAASTGKEVSSKFKGSIS